MSRKAHLSSLPRISSTLYLITPCGVSTSTISPAFVPSNALPTGESLEIFPSKGSAPHFVQVHAAPSPTSYKTNFEYINQP